MENLDTELQAMASIANTLGELEEENRNRVLRWAVDKFGLSEASGRADINHNDLDEQSQSKKYNDFVDLFDAVTPKSNLEKVLTGAYWMQIIQGESSWQSLRVNNLLKDTGNGIDHIVDAIESAQNKTPALVRQMAKSGRSRQARKTFKLTSAGVKFIASKIGSTTATGE